MNEFSNTTNSGLLKIDYDDDDDKDKSAVGESLSKKRRKLSDTLLGPENPETGEERKEDE